MFLSQLAPVLSAADFSATSIIVLAAKLLGLVGAREAYRKGGQ
jgi:hypothetical protein